MRNCWDVIVGLRVEFFPRRSVDPRLGEITGVDGHYLWIAPDDSDNPLRIFWAEVRPVEDSPPVLD